MSNFDNTTKNILIIIIVIATFVLSNYVGLFGLILGLILLGIIGFITNKKTENKSSIVRVIVGALLAILTIVVLIILSSWIIEYFTYSA